MEKSPKKILFCFHEAALSGAPMVLYRYLMHLTENSGFDIHIAVPEHGPLAKELSKKFTVHHVSFEPSTSNSRSAISRMLKKGNSILLMTDLLKSLHPELIYLNTVVFQKYIHDWIQVSKGAKICWHIHELDLACKILDISNLESDKVHLFIANSEETRTFLTEEMGVNKNKIVVQYPAINTAKVAHYQNLTQKPFVVGSVGAGITRKGIELFLLLAAIYKRTYPTDQVLFVWRGSTYALRHEIEYDIRKAQLSNVVLEKAGYDVETFYQKICLYACVSKEESFGLAPVEAMSYGVPLIAFQNSGAVERLAASSGGLAVPYFDLVSFSKAIHLLYEDSLRMNELSVKAIAFASDFTIEKLYPHWWQQVQNLLK